MTLSMQDSTPVTKVVLSYFMCWCIYLCYIAQSSFIWFTCSLLGKVLTITGFFFYKSAINSRLGQMVVAYPSAGQMLVFRSLHLIRYRPDNFQKSTCVCVGITPLCLRISECCLRGNIICKRTLDINSPPCLCSPPLAIVLGNTRGVFSLPSKQSIQIG